MSTKRDESLERKNEIKFSEKEKEGKPREGGRERENSDFLYTKYFPSISL